jgi:hypothetical protein
MTHPEERMRVESPLIPQSLIDSPKIIDNKEVSEKGSGDPQPLEESSSFVPAPLGSSRTYSLSSLRAAVDYHAKFLTVAGNNVEAANHPATIPKAIIDRLSGR